MMTLDGTSILVFLSFLLFMGLMKSLFFEPLLQIKLERDTMVETSHQETQNSQKKAEEVEYEISLRLSQARHQSQTLIQEFREKARAQASELIATAKKQATEQMNAQKGVLHQAQDAVYQELRSEQDEWAQSIAQKVKAGGRAGRSPAGVSGLSH